MHGSKKWIKDYRGEYKRSNNRTKLDYYGVLRWWDCPSIRYYRSGKAVGDFCPQCKHVQKHIQDDSDQYFRVMAIVRAEWDALYGKVSYVKLKEKGYLFFVDFFKQHEKYCGGLWDYNTRSYLCYKHERMYEVDNTRYDGAYHGKKACYNWMVRHSRRKYRLKVKHLMDRAKYDESYYEDITPRRKEWLD